MKTTPALKTKGDRTRLLNTLGKLQLEAAQDKDWTAVTVISGTIYVLAERGDI